MRRGMGAMMVLSLLLGGIFLGKATYLLAKAHLAQVLLESAWTRLRAGEPGGKPWPWADIEPVARLTIPRLDRSVLVLSGISGEAMAFGPGHLSNSAEPGRRGNCVLAGHRDTHFAFLRDLRRKDILQLESRDGTVVRYRIREIFVADHRESWILQPTEENLLTLITCYPFDSLAAGGSQRFIVRATADQPVS